MHCYDATSTYSAIFNLSNDCPVIDSSENEDRMLDLNVCFKGASKGKVHPCTGTEALYRPYGP